MTPDDLFGQPLPEPPVLPAKTKAEPKPKKAAATRREVTEDERAAVLCLKSQVTCPPGTWDKRFVSNLLALTITDKEAPQVWRLFHRYRRQIRHPRKDDLLTIAANLAAPDLRKLAAQDAERQRITRPTGFDDWDEYLRQDGQWRPASEERMDAAQPRQVRRRPA